MQFEKPLIAIRERSSLEILDLTMQVIRTEWKPLSIAWLVGTLPFCLLNWLFTWDLLTRNDIFDQRTMYVFVWLLLLFIEIPLATAPITLYLGQRTFKNEIHVKQLVRDYFSSLWQMFILQGILRASTILLIYIGMILPYVSWPYLSEIVLLERNRMFVRKGAGISTRRRSKNLHTKHGSDFFGRMMLSFTLASMMTGCLILAIYLMVQFLAGYSMTPLEVLRYVFPLSCWLVVGYFAVTRFLSYLDFRIVREGWEVELVIRSEAERLRAISRPLLGAHSPRAAVGGPR